MTWSTRGNQKYYYAQERVGGGRRRVYLGRGAAATLAVLDAEIRRRERGTRQLERQMTQGQPSEEHRQVVAVCLQLRHELRLELHAAGYHQHSRGEWRKRRGSRAKNSH